MGGVGVGCEATVDTASPRLTKLVIEEDAQGPATFAEPGKLRLLEGDMPLDAAYAPRLRAVLYSSEARMPHSSLERQPHQMLGRDPFTLSTFRTEHLLDFAQQDMFFLPPDATDSLM